MFKGPTEGNKIEDSNKDTKKKKSLLQKFQGKAGRAASIFMAASTLATASGEYSNAHSEVSDASKLEIEKIQSESEIYSEESEKIRANFLEREGSKESLAELLIEFNGDQEKAKQKQKITLNFFEKVKIQFAKTENIEKITDDNFLYIPNENIIIYTLEYKEEIKKIIEKDKTIEQIRKEGDINNVESEKMRAELIRQMQSEEYLNKLTIEFDGDQKRAEKELRRRLDQIKITEVIFTTIENIKRITHHDGLYDVDRNLIFVSPEFKNYYDMLYHEFAHASVEHGITDKTRAFLEEKSFPCKLSCSEQLAYLKQPEEMMARKKQLDLELEKLGIKKYEDEATDEHIKKMFERRNELSNEAKALLFIFSSDYEDLKKLLNGVAKSEGVEKNKRFTA